MNPPYFGRKNECPRCGSAEVRALRTNELVEIYGYPQFVLTMPRFCKMCRHCWEVRSPAGAVVMLVASVLGVLYVLAMLAAAIFACAIWFREGKLIEAIHILVLMLAGGPAIILVLVYALRRYRRHIQQVPDEARSEQDHLM